MRFDGGIGEGFRKQHYFCCSFDLPTKVRAIRLVMLTTYLHVGLASSHFFFLLRQVKQPVRFFLSLFGFWFASSSRRVAAGTSDKAASATFVRCGSESIFVVARHRPSVGWRARREI